MRNIAILLTVVAVSSARDPACPYPSDVITFLPNRQDCTKFFECYRGEKSEIKCPANLFWNQKAKACDYKCDFEDGSTPVPQPTAAPTAAPVPTRNPMCPYPSQVITFFPNKEDCTKFYECFEGKRSEFHCPANLFWNQRAKVCDYKCDFGDDTSPAPAPTAPGPDPVPTRNPMCPYPSNEIIYFPDRQDCSKFFECYDGKRSEISCPARTFWNQRAKVCDYKCDFGDNTPSPAPIISSTPAPAPIVSSTSAPSPVNICKGKQTGTFLPDPTNCRNFIECVNGKSVLTACPSGTYWDQEILSCVNGAC